MNLTVRLRSPSPHGVAATTSRRLPVKPGFFIVLAMVAFAVPLAGAPGVHAAPAAPDGETVFRQRCQACHSATAGQPSRLGPNLAGVVGRKAASLAFNYSPALKKSGVTWSRTSLDRYLAAPNRMIPGTRMTVTLSDGVQRAALINYLAGRK